MIELTLLGPHVLRASNGRELTSLPAQPKRFALLAYLALGAGAGYHRRDSLAALFWPELDQFAARRALRNTLYHLREALGDKVIVVSGGDAIAIDPEALTCDATRLAAAVAAARFEEAVECFRGELLAGLHVPNAGEAFEEWLVLERRRTVELVLRALRSLVDRDESAGDHVAALRWARRACELAPDDEGWLRRTMALLGRGSDTGDALRMYERYSQRLSAEFGAAPSAETRDLASRLRTGAAQTDGPTAMPPTKAAIAPTARPASRPTAAPIASTSVLRMRRPKRTLLWVSAIGAVLAVVLIGAAANARRAHADPPRVRVLVTVFDDRTGDARLRSLGRMTQDWLVRRLVRAHLVDVVDQRSVFTQIHEAAAPPTPIELARRTGATFVISGAYDRSGDTLLVQATVVDVRTSGVLRAVGPIAADERDPVRGIDALSSRVASALASIVDVRATHDLGRASEIPPFEAYQAYVDGWDAYWHGDAVASESLFVRAARLDTEFTPAIVAAAVPAANSNGCATVDSLARVLARTLAARHQPVDRVDDLTMRIADARCRGRNDEMLRLTLERAELEPGDASAQMSAAAAASWANRPAKVLELLAQVNPAVDLAWSTDTTHFAYWSGMTEALHMLGRYRDELAAADHVPSSTPLTRIWLRGSALAALSRPAELLALIDSSLTLPVETTSDLGLAPFTNGRPEYSVTPAWIANWIARELVTHGDTVTARQAALRAVEWYRGRPAAERATIEEQLVQSWSLEVLQRFADAERVARALVAIDSTNVDFRGELAGLAAEQGKTALADSLDHWLAAQSPARVSWTASLYRARLAALAGRPDDAMARLRDAFDLGIWPSWLHEEPAFVGLRRRADFAALTAPRG
jgi:DNA-binding SARP family transcriptional activator/TolB-like protein